MSFTDHTYVDIILLLRMLTLYYYYYDYIMLYRLQEEYHPTDDTTQTEEEEKAEGSLRKEKKIIVFEYCLLKLLEQCRSCGQEVELNTSVRGTLLVVHGTCPDGHVLNWQSQPLVRDMGPGNLMIATAILFCGLTFTGISNLANCKI